MKAIGKYFVGVVISTALIITGALLISQARREYKQDIPVVDPAVYSSGPEEQMIGRTHSADKVTRVRTETNYYYLLGGIGLILFGGGYWAVRFVSSKKTERKDREEIF